MSVKVLQNIKDAIGNLNPEEIRRHTERPLRLFLYAHSENAYRQMEDFLVAQQALRIGSVCPQDRATYAEGYHALAANMLSRLNDQTIQVLNLGIR